MNVNEFTEERLKSLVRLALGAYLLRGIIGQTGTPQNAAPVVKIAIDYANELMEQSGILNMEELRDSGTSERLASIASEPRK